MPAVCLCVRSVDSLTSTLASQERGEFEESVEDLPPKLSEEIVQNLPHQLSVEESRCQTGNPTQNQFSEFVPTLPSVYLPSHPPVSPIPTYFPFPPADCLYRGVARTPGSARQTVLSCPTSRGYSCSSGTLQLFQQEPY